MVRVEYGNGIVEVTYSRSRNRSSSSCGSSCSGYSTVQFYSVRYYFQWHKTANVYVKNCSVYIQCKGDIVVVDIKQHKSQFKSSNFTITQSAKGAKLWPILSQISLPWQWGSLRGKYE